MRPDEAFLGILALGLLLATPVSGSEATGAIGSAEASANAPGTHISISREEGQLEFEPAPEGWQTDVAWQVFGFNGSASLPQFFYRIPSDPDEAKAMIETISDSPLVGRVQLLNAVVTEPFEGGSAAGPVVSDVHASWEVRWEGMGRAAPWVRKADSTSVLQELIEVSAMSEIAAGDHPVPDRPTADPSISRTDLILGINVPIRNIEKHSVGSGTLQAVRNR